MLTIKAVKWAEDGNAVLRMSASKLNELPSYGAKIGGATIDADSKAFVEQIGDNLYLGSDNVWKDASSNPIADGNALPPEITIADGVDLYPPEPTPAPPTPTPSGGGIDYSTEEQDTGLKHCFDMDGYFDTTIYQRTITNFISRSGLVEELEEAILVVSSELVATDAEGGAGTVQHSCVVYQNEDVFTLEVNIGEDVQTMALTIRYLKPSGKKGAKLPDVFKKEAKK